MLRHKDWRTRNTRSQEATWLKSIATRSNCMGKSKNTSKTCKNPTAHVGKVFLGEETNVQKSQKSSA
ncbi:hypothetical protein AV530_008616 [Patagioenas fasciata monilis]|uniref:Uncharacterized protein n=1 Tax=Patagioenas fasciata monilis TaxID=372326 RepID=A0A1V4L1A5_PATFA|nr:hypothetical protein AV530_008616 [Patagioenas fasciata monilis]